MQEKQSKDSQEKEILKRKIISEQKNLASIANRLLLIEATEEAKLVKKSLESLKKVMRTL